MTIKFLTTEGPREQELNRFIEFLKKPLTNTSLVIPLTISQISDAELKDLIYYLYTSDTLPVYKLVIPDNAKQNQIIHDIQHAADHRHFASNTTLKAITTDAKQRKGMLRKAKIDFVMEQDNGLGLQMQQQQQQQQQQEEEPTEEKRRRKQKKEQTSEKVNVSPKFEVSDLINAANIETDAKLIAFNEALGSKKVNLKQVWQNLVGPNAHLIKNHLHTITDVSRAAMEQIILHQAEFSYGLIPDNDKLPSGFLLLEIPDNHHVLDFSKNTAYQHPSTPLTIQLREPEPLATGSYNQLVLSKINSEDDEIDKDYLWNIATENLSDAQKSYHDIKKYKEQISLLTGTDKKKSKQALLYFIKELGPQIPGLEALISKTEWASVEQQGLSSILLNQGVTGLAYFFQQMKDLKDQGLYTEFNQLFLGDANNYLQVVSQPGIDNLKDLIKLSTEEKIWWESIVQQHKDKGNRVDFNELFAAFSHFLISVKAIPLANLTTICPFTNIGHMKPALERALYILQNANDVDDQLTCLNGLDFSSTGAYHAMHFNGYYIASEEMQLTSTQASQVADADLYSPPLNPTGLMDVMNPKNATYNAAETSKSFYRYLAKQNNPYPISVFRKIKAEVEQDTDLSEQQKSAILGLVAVCSNGTEEVSNPEPITKKLIKELKSTKIAPVLIDALSDLIKLFPQANTLSLEDLRFIIRYINTPLILEKMPENLQLLMQFIPHFINNIPAAHHILENILLVQGLNSELLTGQINFLNTLCNKIKERTNNQPLNTDFITLAQLLLRPEDCKNIDQIDNLPILALFNQLQDLNNNNPKIYTTILGLLKEINLERSFEVPTVQKIAEFITAISTTQVAEKSDLSIKNELATQLADAFPNTTFGSEQVNESLFNLVSIVKTSWKVTNATGNIDVMVGRSNSYMKLVLNFPIWGEDIYQKILVLFQPIRKQIKDFDVLVDKNPLEVLSVIDSFAAIEKELAQLIGMKVLGFELVGLASPMITTLAHNANPNSPVSPEDVAEFLKTKKLLIFMRSSLEDNFTKSLNNTLKRMQVNIPGFNDYIYAQLGKLDTSRSVKESLTEFSDRFNTTNDFLNALIRIKNTNEKSYRAVISLLDNYKPDIPYLLPIINILEQQNALPIQEQLTIILEALKNSNSLSKANHVQAREQLVKLNQQKDLSADDYRTLMQATFAYNLNSSQGVFPLTDIIALKHIQNLEANLAQALFDKVILFIQKVPAGINEGLIRDTINNIVTTIKKYPKISAEVGSLLLVLLPMCIPATRDNVAALNKFIAEIPQDNPEAWLTIMSRFISGSKPTMDQLIQLKQKLVQHKEILPKIASLYQYRPYPKLKTILAKLDSRTALEEFIKAFDKDPLEMRKSERIINKQFDTQRILPNVIAISDILSASNLSTDEQFKIAQQLTFINAIGKDYPIKIGGQNCESLIKATRPQLREFCDYLINDLRQGTMNSEQTRETQLKLLAVLRELYFRTTGKFPYSTQMLSLIVSLENPNNLIMEINTGEGKSIITAMLSVLEWAKGDITVDVSTANQKLVHQDYPKAHDFFDALGIESTIISKESPNGTYKVGGINYTTISDLSLYTSRAKIEGEDLTNKDGISYRKSLTIDEFDQPTLDDRTQFNFTVGAIGGGDGLSNPYEWIYPIVNEFIELPKFKNVTDEDAWTPGRDIIELKKLLSAKASTTDQKNQLSDKALSDKKLGKWIDAACAAHQLVERKNFIIKKKTRKDANGLEIKYDVAIPVIQNNPQNGAVFSDGVHQFLHALLRKPPKNLNAPIDPEMLIADTRTGNDIIAQYSKQGRIIGISGSAGTKEELSELRHKLDFTSIKIPPHEQSKRIVRPTSVKRNSGDQRKAIINALNSIAKIDKKDGQPSLLVCKDISQAHELFEQLQEIYGDKVQLVTGEEDNETYDKCMERAGHKDVITVSTSLLGRGTDIDPDHPDGLFVIQCYLDTVRASLQILGRAARNGRVGTYLAIFNQNGITQQYDIGSLTFLKSAQLEEAIKKLQKQMDTEGGIARYYTQEISYIEQTILNQLDEWHALLDINLGEDQKARDYLKINLIEKRQNLILELTELWKEHLEKSDPNKDFINPFLRKDDQGGFETEALNQALADFKQDALNLWHEYNEDLLEANKNISATQIFKNIDMLEELKLGKLHIENEASEAKKQNTLSATQVAYALDNAAAVIKYSGDRTSTAKYFDNSIHYQLDLLADQFNQVIGNKEQYLNFYSDTSIQEKVSLLINKFSDYIDELDTKVQLHPIFNEFLRVTDTFKGLDADKKQIKTLKTSYFTDLTHHILTNLEHGLSWAKPQNHGLLWLIERAPVRTAALKIQTAIDILNNSNPADKPKLIQELYKELHYQKVCMEQNIWFSWGQKNTRNLIKNTLNMLDNLSQTLNISSAMKKACSEDAVHNLYMEEFSRTLNAVSPKTEVSATWTTILNKIQYIKTHNTSVYVFADLEHYLNKIKHDPNFISLHKAIGKLVANLQKSQQSMRMRYQDIMETSSFLTTTKTKLEQELKHIPNIKIQQLVVQKSHNGMHDFYEVRIKGSGLTNAKIFDTFIRYNSKYHEMTVKRDELQKKHAVFEQKINLIQQCKQQIVSGVHPLIGYESLSSNNAIQAFNSVTLQLTSNISSMQISKAIEQLQSYKIYSYDKIAENHLGLELPEVLSSTKSSAIKTVLREFFEAKKQFFPKKNVLMKSFISALDEGIADLTDQLKILVSNEEHKQSAAKILEKILNNEEQLTKKAAHDVGNAINLIEFKMKKETEKSSVIVKEFKSLDELLDFSEHIREQPEVKNARNKPETVPDKAETIIYPSRQI
ncbi:MAG: hypothetical protein WC627_10580 [Legionella sp.]|jgi:hypothetical protein